MVSVTCKTRRHVFELVEEFADMVWWSAILTGFTWSIATLADRPRLWFFLGLCFLPIGRFLWEVISWWREVLVLEEAPAGGVIRRKWGVLRDREVKDSLKNVAIVKNAPIHYKLIGAVNLHVSSATNTYIDSHLVPVHFWDELDRATSGITTNVEVDTGDPILNALPLLVQVGLVDPRLAKAYTERTLTARLI
jgi:hypothetical protein